MQYGVLSLFLFKDFFEFVGFEFVEFVKRANLKTGVSRNQSTPKFRGALVS